MRLFNLLLGCLLAVAVAGAEELRTWTDVKGNRVEALFVKAEGPSVFLKLKDGKVVPARLDNLCEADRAHVRALASAPREVIATFRKNGFGSVGEEIGSSPVATLRDLVSLRVQEETEGKKVESAGDSRWKIASVDALGSRIAPRKEGLAEELETEGKFIFITYTVENDSSLPITVSPPVLADRRGRKFLQTAKDNARAYIPEKALLAGEDPVPPGFTKLFCSFYELPLSAEPVSVEVFPSRTSRAAIEQFEVKGKTILLDETAAAAAAPKPAEVAPPAAPEKKASVFLKCVRVGQGGDTSSYWYYDRNKKRSLSYGLELRGMGDQAQPVTVKAFFVGAISGNRDAVVDKKSESVAIEPGKITRIALQSNEVEEYNDYFYSGSRVSGAKLKGVIVQVWRGDEIVTSFVSLNQWKRFADSPDVAKQMGELTATER